MTIEQLKQFLSMYAVNLPDFVLQIIIDKVATVEACLVGAGYSAEDKALIELYAAAIMAMNTGVRMVSSQSAPNGAGRSFEQSNAVAMLRGSLAALDTSGCTNDLVTGGESGYASFDVVRV